MLKHTADVVPRTFAMAGEKKVSSRVEKYGQGGKQISRTLAEDSIPCADAIPIWSHSAIPIIPIILVAGAWTSMGEWRRSREIF